jgi:hypothetical protein
MSTRDILQIDVDELVPVDKTRSRKLPVRDAMPKNISSLGEDVARMLGLPFVPEDPLEIEIMIRRWRR